MTRWKGTVNPLPVTSAKISLVLDFLNAQEDREAAAQFVADMCETEERFAAFPGALEQQARATALAGLATGLRALAERKAA
ncbi:hypothetical protein ABZ860_33080 [Microbispora sp. NPDC046973]|uniref:hypothetical protein n=1 Tax=Microbispora sp. NPDC046973 TaxID=3155022 RepID=UPI0033CCBBDF